MSPLLQWVAAGLVLGAGFTIVAGGAGRRRGLAIYAVGLAVAALVYVGFAVVDEASTPVVMREVAGVLLYGVLAVVGVSRYPWLVGGGWLLHGLWDGLVHRLGTTTHVPDEYRWACLGFDAFVGLKVLWDLRTTER